MQNEILTIFRNAALYTLQTVKADGLYLFLSIFIAVAMSVYIDPKKTRKFFLKQNKFLISGSIGLGAFTPLCACGTMAVVISLLTTALPLGPIMAFLVSSPLMSPDTFILISGFMGVEFAVFLTIASIILGFTAGYLTSYIDRKTNFLKNQFRVAEKPVKTGKTLGRNAVVLPKNCCVVPNVQPNQLTLVNACSIEMPIENASTENIFQLTISKLKVYEFTIKFYEIGIKKILPLFLLFVLIAYAVKTFVPTEWIIKLFSGNNFFAVPIAAIVGLPLYVSDATIAPLLEVLKEGGASQGSLLAFMIAGPGTSLAVIVGLNVVLKKKAIFLYVLYIFVGAIVLGYLYDLIYMLF